MQYKVAGYKDTYTYKSKTDIDRFFFLFFLFLSIRRAVPKTKISHKDAHDPVAPRNWVILRPQQKTSFRFLPKKLLFACLSRNFLDNDPSFSPSFSSFSFDRFGIRNTRRGKKEETHVGRSFKNGGSTFVSIPFLLFPPEYNQRLCFRFFVPFVAPIYQSNRDVPRFSSKDHSCRPIFEREPSARVRGPKWQSCSVSYVTPPLFFFFSRKQYLSLSVSLSTISIDRRIDRSRS